MSCQPRRETASALMQLDDVIFTSHRRQVVELAARHQLAVMYGFKEFVQAGGLMVYGPPSAR